MFKNFRLHFVVIRISKQNRTMAFVFARIYIIREAKGVGSTTKQDGHMIDNVVLIIAGTLQGRDVQELLGKCHPLGKFDGIADLAVAQNVQKLRVLLHNTSLGPYFPEFITSEDFSEWSIAILKSAMYKAFLEDFYQRSQKLGGATAEIMSDLLAFESDRRAVKITINSIETGITVDDRRSLYSSFGLLYPYGHVELAFCEDLDQVRLVMKEYPSYHFVCPILSAGKIQMLDKAFLCEEVKRLRLSFEQQANYALFYAYWRLRNHEICEVTRMCERVAQNQVRGA